MNNIEIFKNKQFGEIRTIVKSGQPYFVGKDIAQSLGYKRPTKAISDHVEKEDIDEVPIQDSIGRKQKTPIINESGMYALIFGSKLESAKEFKHWVTSEVLPSIRKHGAYMTDKTLDEIADDPELLIKLATNLKEERDRRKELEVENEKKNQIIGELQPRADYTDTILQNKGLVTITQIAKDYGLSGQAMNTLLHELKVQYKQSEQWLLYAEHHGKGYTHSETIPIVKSNGQKDIKMNTKWTQKGRLFLYKLLKENETLPLIERSV